MSDLVGFHHVAITVRDCDASADWYANVLGFQEMFRESSETRKGCVMQFPGGAFGVGLVEHTATSGDDAFAPTRLGLDHVGFKVGSRDALDDFAARLEAAGVAHSGVIESPRGAILNFKDPDNIALACFWDRA
jgi:glyoxylase I family protein